MRGELKIGGTEMKINIKDFLELCVNDFCSISVYDQSTGKTEYFSHPQEVISKYGLFPVTSWEIEKFMVTRMAIKTKTEF